MNTPFCVNFKLANNNYIEWNEWEKFDNLYPMFESNHLTTRVEGKRWCNFTNSYNETVSINLEYTNIYYEMYDREEYVLRIVIQKGYVTESVAVLKKIAYKMIDDSGYFDAFHNDVKDPGCE